jgi:hypothetical protein
MEQVAPIIKAIASLSSLLWTGFAFTVLYLFKSQIREAIQRLAKVEIFALKIELHKLHAFALATEKEVQELVILDAEPGQYSIRGESATARVDQEETFGATINSILQQAATEPKLALVALAAELEKQARQALATRGVLGGRRAVSLRDAVNGLNQYGFPPNLAVTLRLFLDVRDRIVHGMAATNDDALSALDSGLVLLRALNALPHETNVVYHPGVEIFLDAECQQPITDAKGLILETTSPGGATKMHRIFPTTRTDYQKGKRVAWEWNMQKKWPNAWYRDPDTGDIKKAWIESTEFIGRHLHDI